MRVRDSLTRDDLALTPSEAKIAQVLLADYPLGGLGTAASLAKKAGVSDPTVARLVAKLGFDGFGDLQARLLEEVEARLHSPLLMMEAKRKPATDEHVCRAYLRSVARQMEQCADIVPARLYEQVGAMTMRAGRVLLLGGRFSRHLAGILAGYLAQFRGGVGDLGVCSSETFDCLVDLGRRDLLIVFDYRRYQTDVVRFAEQAAARGVRIVLFTDPFLSPIAPHAEVVIVAPVEVASPYDSLAPAMAQVEALSTHLVAERTERMQERIEAIEAARAVNSVTLDASSVAQQAGEARA
jgi:DNA-binding MurR/RpiR family transcriptional regulator